MVAYGVPLLRRRCPVTVGAQVPTPGRGIHRGVEYVVQLSSQPRVLDLGHHLDTSVEITMHHVGAADPELVDGAEVNNPRVFEEAAEDRAHDDVVGVSGGARLERTDAAHYHLDPDPGLRSAVERVDDLLVHQRVGLHPDSSLRSVAGGGDFALDALDDPPARTVWRHQQVAVGLLARVARQ